MISNNDFQKRAIVGVLVFGVAFLLVALVSQFRDGKGMLALLRGNYSTEETQDSSALNTAVGLDETEVPILLQEDEETAKVYEKVAPSVVSITTEDMQGGSRNRVVEQGSGVIVTERGHVVTNYHVVTGDKVGKLKYLVELLDGTLFEADLVGIDPVLDLALLKIRSEDTFQAVPFGDSDEVKVGHKVFAFGNPFRLGVSFSEGNVAARDRFLSEIQHDLFQITASLNPGQSGGPLVNVKGELIGINSSIYTKDKEFPGFQGIAFSIHSNEVKNSVTAILQKKLPVRGYIGITLGTINDYNRRILKYDKKVGALIYDVAPDSPAEAAGLKRQDIVTHFNGKSIVAGRHLIALLKRNANNKVSLTLWSEGKEKKVSVELGEAGRITSEEPMQSSDEKLAKLFTKIGITPGELSSRERSRGLYGVRVDGVSESSLAAEALIQKGDYIYLMNGMRFSRVHGFVTMLRRSVLNGETELRIFRASSKSVFTVRFPKLEIE